MTITAISYPHSELSVGRNSLPYKEGWQPLRLTGWFFLANPKSITQYRNPLLVWFVS